MIGVLVVAEAPAVRAGLIALLRDQAHSLQVLGSGRAIREPSVMNVLPHADVAVLDAGGSRDLSDVLAPLESAGVGLLVLGPSSLASQLVAERPTVAWGVIPREADIAQMVPAIQAVAAGLLVLDPEVSLVARPAPTDAIEAAASTTPDDLTAREREVLGLVALGLTNKAVAQRLAISDHTVKFHVAAVLAKLGAESRTEAVNIGVRRGLVSL